MAVSFSSDVNYTLKTHPGPIMVCDASRKCSREAKYTAQRNRAVLQLDTESSLPRCVDLDNKPDKRDCLDEIGEAVESIQGGYRGRL